MKDKYTKKIVGNFMKQDLDRLGLETYDGCRVSLLESIQTEFGDDVLKEVFQNMSDQDVIAAAHHALLTLGMIDCDV